MRSLGSHASHIVVFKCTRRAPVLRVPGLNSRSRQGPIQTLGQTSRIHKSRAEPLFRAEIPGKAAVPAQIVQGSMETRSFLGSTTPVRRKLAHNAPAETRAVPRNPEVSRNEAAPSRK